MAETMREKSSIPTTAGSPGGPQAPSKSPSSSRFTGGITCVFVGNFTDFIRSDEAADRFQGVFLHTRSTATKLSHDAAAGTVFASRRRNGGAGQRPCATRRFPRDRTFSKDPATHHDGHRNADSRQPAGRSISRLRRGARWRRIRSGTRAGGGADADHRTRSGSQHGGRSDGSEQEDHRAVDRAATPGPPAFDG